MHESAGILIRIVEIPPTGPYPSKDGRRIFRTCIHVGEDGGEHTLTIICPHTPQEELRLRWYFEAHFERPYTDQVRAQQAAASVAAYGHALFGQIFKADQVLGEQLEPLLSPLQSLRIEIEGSSAFHALHWEALCQPGHEPLLIRAQMVRRLTHRANPASFRDSAQLRVLLVTARAQDPREVAYRTISQPLVDALGDGGQVRVDLLRPGRYSALEALLDRTTQEHGQGYYHIIHFDLHGSVSRPSEIADMPSLQSTKSNGQCMATDSLQGYLYFEPEIDGTADDGTGRPLYRAIDAITLTSLLGAHGAPIVVLNSCQSAMQMGDGETSLGARLLDGSVQVVIAMSYSVLVEAATKFVRRFYERLVETASVAEAMRDARCALFSDRTRSGRFNIPIELEDWLLPVMYQNRELRFQLRQPTREETATLSSAEARTFPRPTTEYGFFGRDLDVLAIERGLLRHNLLLVCGMGGAGKSTLLRHLGHWWQRTGWIGEVFEFGYDQRCWTRQQILNAIAQKLLAPAVYDSFVPTSAAEQQEKIVQLLHTQRHLLLLDNLETITGSHLAIGQALSESERDEVREFLGLLIHGRSFVLLGSRSGEDWLKTGTFDSNIHELQGLDPSARALMSCTILRRIGQEALLGASAPVGAEQVAGLDALQRLLKLLGGFPLAMEVVLPALANEPLQNVLAALERGDVDLDSGDPEDKTRSIVRCIDYAFSRLDAGAQQMLACLAPFTGVFNSMYGDKYLEHLRRQDMLHALPFDRWDEVLQAATQWGLVTRDAHLPDLLHLQPTLPYFLRQRLSSLPTQRAAIERAFRDHFRGLAAVLAASLLSRNPTEKRAAQFLAQTEFENFYRAIREALRAQESIRALYVLLLEHFAQTQELRQVRALADEVLAGLTHYPETVLTGALAGDHVMAMIVSGTQRREDRRYPEAESAYRRALQRLQTLNNMSAQERGDLTATIYQELGMCAQEQGQWAQAEDHYHKVLDSKAQYGGDFSLAGTYHQLGTVALAQRQWQQAQEHFRKALEIDVELNDTHKQAQTYHELGILAQEQGQWEQAEAHFRKALEIKIEFNDRYGQSSTHHQLGQVAYEQRLWSQAEAHFRRALEIRIEFNDRYKQAGAYHSLGDVALEQGQWAQAEQHFERSLEIFIEFNDRHQQGGVYHQLGTLAERQRQWPQAEERLLRALGIFVEFNDRRRQAGTCVHLGNVACHQNQWPQAEGYYRRALEVFIEIDDRFRQGAMYHQLGAIAQELRQWQQAEALGLQAVVLFAECQDEHGTLAALHALACLWRQTQSAGLLEAVAQLIGATSHQLEPTFKQMLEWGGTNAWALRNRVNR